MKKVKDRSERINKTYSPSNKLLCKKHSFLKAKESSLKKSMDASVFKWIVNKKLINSNLIPPDYSWLEWMWLVRCVQGIDRVLSRWSPPEQDPEVKMRFYAGLYSRQLTRNLRAKRSLLFWAMQRNQAEKFSQTSSAPENLTDYFSSVESFLYLHHHNI